MSHYKVEYNHCNCHLETCACDDFVILRPDGSKFLTVFNHKIAAELVDKLNGLEAALRQILGWRELRNTNEIPIERIEDIARKALAQLDKEGG